MISGLPLLHKKTQPFGWVSFFLKPAFPRKLLLSGSPTITSERFRPSSLLAGFAGSENHYLFLNHNLNHTSLKQNQNHTTFLI